jgi:hypothetical protein
MSELLGQSGRALPIPPLPVCARSWRISTLFEQFVGCDENRLRHDKAERLCRAGVDDQLEFGRPQHRKVVRLGAA